MVKVIFVGDKPSTKNVSEDIPFVGASCFNRLVSWIKRINPDYYVCLNSETNRELSDIEVLSQEGFRVIAFGTQACVRLRDRGISHMYMPHPSGRNLMTNDEELISKALEEAWIYVRSGNE